MMHHRRSLTAILSVIALAFAALTFAAPAMASPQRAAAASVNRVPAASVNLCQTYALDVAEIVDNNGTGYLLDNPGHNNIVRTVNNQYVTYSFMNCQRWTDKFAGNQSVYVTEFGFPDLHLCIDAATNGDMYLESCIKGDANELFYVTNSGGPGPYIISVGQSELWDQNMYMTALSLSNNALVYAAGAGNGTRAQWRFGLVSLRAAG
jgi:hypothetical protein